MTAQVQQPALPLRSHTILGVCEGLGEDFGFNPMWIRVPLAAAVLWSPLGAIGIYLALGLVVFASRLMFPERKGAVQAEASSCGAMAETAANEQRELAKAA